MKTKELIALLKSLDPKGVKEVFLSSDEEGNSYGTTNPQAVADGKKSIILYPWIETCDYPEEEEEE